ncbi:uncharacterized protein LKV04_006280 [Tautogolabrus adspersus]
MQLCLVKYYNMNSEHSQSHCSSYPVDRSTGIPSGGRQQIVPPAESTQWNLPPVKHQPSDNCDRAGEEFLRCIAANKPLPHYLKGNMAYNLADAFKSASILKEAVKSDPEFKKHATKSKSRSRSRSRGRSRGKSRGRSRAKSRARSKSRADSRSRGRSKSRVRGKSMVRSKSRVRSRSRSQSRSKKSHVRSKSHVRRSKSRSSSGEKSRGNDKKRKRSPSHSMNSNLAGSSLLEGLKLVMNSKENRLPDLKDAIFTIKAPDDSKGSMPDDHRQQEHSQENSTSIDNDSMLLPHDRVGCDFSWLQTQSEEVSAVQKSDELEDEESFLYGNGEHDKPQGKDSHSQNRSMFNSLEMTSLNLASANLDSIECEKVKNILKSLGSTDISNFMGKMQGQKEEKQPLPTLSASDQTAAALALPALSNPDVRQALESLQSLIKATKEKRAKSDGSGTSQASFDKHKVGDVEDGKREKKAVMNKMESLMKQLEELLKQDGLGFLTPVIGFYCQKCEEFIGDLNSAESHAAIHRNTNPSSKGQTERHAGDSKERHSRYPNSSSNQHSHSSDRRDHRDHGYRRDTGEHRNPRDQQREWKDERGHRSQHNDEHKSHKAGQENISLQEEMKKERMLITVSRGQTPPPNIRVKEEVDKEKANRGKVKVEDNDSKGGSSSKGREKEKGVKDENSDSDTDKVKKRKRKSPKKVSDSSDSSDSDKGKKTKSPKKKKKKEKKKKKDKRNKS